MSLLYLLLPNPVQTNQLGTGFGSQGQLVGIVPNVTPLGELLALHISARDIWAHIQICLAYENATNHNFLPNNANLFCVVCWKPSSLLSNVHFRNTTKIAVQVLLLLTLFTFTFEPFLKL